MRFKTISHDSVMLYFEDEISEDVLDEVQTVYNRLKNLDHIIDLTPSYSSILIQYDMKYFDYKNIKEKILQHIKSDKLIEIKVDYSQGLDLKRVASLNNLSIEEVIKKHTDITYRVYAIGFLEGFAYLAKVDSQIATPRLKTPRDKVKKGSVAIADNQTAIYPEDSAGGWNIIGITEFDNFDKFEIGDRVRFISV